MKEKSEFWIVLGKISNVWASVLWITFVTCAVLFPIDKLTNANGNIKETAFWALVILAICWKAPLLYQFKIKEKKRGRR